MIKFKTITLRNFLSVGNIIESISLQHDDLTLILGKNLDISETGSRNGVGKSTIVQALCYVLYDKTTTGISKDNLINKLNKRDMCVTLDFDVDNVSYRIVRGRKKNILQLFIDDIDASDVMSHAKGEMKDTQQHIEEIIGMSFNMFANIVVSDTNFTPFLAMRAKERNELIEELLGITVLSHKAAKSNELLKNTKADIAQETQKIALLEDGNKRIQQNIVDLEHKSKQFDKKLNNEIDTLTSQIATLAAVDIDQEISNHTQLAMFGSLETQMKTLHKDIDNANYRLKIADRDKRRLEQELVSLDNSVCSSCGQKITDGSHAKRLEEVAALYQKAITDYNVMAESKDSLATLLDKCSRDYEQLGVKPTTTYNNQADAFKHKSTIDSLTSQKEALQRTENPYNDQISSLKNTALVEVDYGTIEELNKLLNHQTFIYKLLSNKDSFVRKQIISQNLSFLNKRLSHYLVKMGLPHRVVFLTDLNVEIMNMGETFDFGNLSRGEKQRLILSLNWAFRDVWESTHKHINLMFIDEILDSGLDPIAVESAVGLLKHMNFILGKDVFIISHREELIARVKNVLMAVKERGFTTYRENEDVE